VCLLLAALALAGCAGEMLPDPAPPPELGEPLIDHFEKKLPDGSWETTQSGARGSIIGVVGEGFGDDAGELSVSYNGAEAEITGLQEIPESGLKRIVTVVPEQATSGPVVVSRSGVPGPGKQFTIIVIANASTVRDIVFEPEAAGPLSYGVWLGTTPGGVIRFDGDLADLEAGRFQRHTTAQGLFSNRVSCLMIDNRGRLLAGTDNGGLSFRTPSGFTTFLNWEGFSSNRVLTLHQQPSGELLVGLDNGLAVWRAYGDVTDEQLEFYAGGWFVPSIMVFLQERRVWDVLALPDAGELLIACSDGIYRTEGDWEFYDLEKVFPGDGAAPQGVEVFNLGLDRQGHLLAGTAGMGLLRFGTPGDFARYDRFDLGGEDVRPLTRIVFSPGGFNYLVTEGSGGQAPGALHRFTDEGGAARLDRLAQGPFAAVGAAPDGRVFLSSKDGGLFAFPEEETDPDAWERSDILRMLASNEIQCLAPDGSGGVFLGTRSVERNPQEKGGVSWLRWDFGTPSPAGVFLPRIPGVPEGFVSALTPLPAGGEGVFVGSSRGLGRLTGSAPDFAYDPLMAWQDGFHRVTGVLALEDGGGDLLLGTLLDGLLAFSEMPGREGAARVSHGTVFDLPPDAFALADLVLPRVPGTSGGVPAGGEPPEFVRYGVRLDPEHERPGTGVILRLPGGGEPQVQLFLDLVLQERGAARAEEVSWPVLLRGTAPGAGEEASGVSLVLDGPAQGVQTEWVRPAAGDPAGVRIELEAEAPAPGAAAPGATLAFRIDSLVSGVFHDLVIPGLPPLPVRLSPFRGRFTAEPEQLPVPVESPSPGLAITCLLHDRGGNVLIGTQQDGLWVLRPDEPGVKDQAFVSIEAFAGRGVSALAADPAGRIFVGTFLSGVYLLEGHATGEPAVHKIDCFELRDACVTALAADGDGRLIAGLYDPEDGLRCGIAVYSNDQDALCFSLRSDDGLIPARIQDLLLDGGNLYAATLEGLCIIPQFEALADRQFERLRARR